MPSARGTCWKYDMWLPRALALRLQYPEGHPWYKVVTEYANADSASTLALWKAQKREIERRDLWEVYKGMALPRQRLAYLLEKVGVTVSAERTLKPEAQFA